MDTTTFFENLQRRASGDTAVVATLRRSLMYEPGAYPPAFPFVEPFADGLSAVNRRLAYLAAGLWASAARREPGKAYRIGEAWRVLHGRQDSKRSTEARFVSLIGADEDELNWRLRQATKLLSSAGIDIDWPMLLRHLFGWSHPDRWVQQSWARDFWRETDAAATETATVIAAASATEQA